MLNKAAWRFDDPRPKLIDISDRRFSMDSALGIVPLTDAEAAKVLALPRTASPLLTSFRARIRIDGEGATRRRGAPPPSWNTRTGVMHMRRAPAYTYALALGNVGEAYFKIGWAFDWKRRMRGFNQAAMPDLGGLRYTPYLSELWDTAMDAFRMEQALLRKFDKARHTANREVVTGISKIDLELAWASIVRRPPWRKALIKH